MELPVDESPIVAPLTNPFEASSARTVMVIEEVPSALRVKGFGALRTKLAITAVEDVGVTTVVGVLASPPPPPHAVKVAAISKPVIVFRMDIFTALFMR